MAPPLQFLQQVLAVRRFRNVKVVDLRGQMCGQHQPWLDELPKSLLNCSETPAIVRSVRPERRLIESHAHARLTRRDGLRTHEAHVAGTLCRKARSRVGAATFKPS